jgi:hypothetical protein
VKAVEVCGNRGRRLTCRMGGFDRTTVVESALDGREVSVLVGGKACETMAIKLVDAPHLTGVAKVN